MNRFRVHRAEWSKRLTATAFMATAIVLALAALAWACTQRVGTLLVCQPPSKTFVDSSRCGRVTGTTQTGSPSFSANGGQTFSARATNFQRTAYNVTFLRPNSTSSCHRAGTDTRVLTSTNGKTQFVGPSFYAEFSTNQVADMMAGNLGVAKLCSQDMPDIIIGQVINVAVV